MDGIIHLTFAFLNSTNGIIALREESGIEDINELCKILNISDEDRDIILECSKTYKKQLLLK